MPCRTIGREVPRPGKCGSHMMLKKITVLLVLSCLASAIAHAVPAVPNEAVARGTVVESGVSSPTGPSAPGRDLALYKIVMKVDAVEDRGDAPNFLKGKEGRVMTFWSMGRPAPGLVGKKVKAIVEYRGDERGGKFWIRKIEIIP
jgi:hypothetical protein